MNKKNREMGGSGGHVGGHPAGHTGGHVGGRAVCELSSPKLHHTKMNVPDITKAGTGASSKGMSSGDGGSRSKGSY